MYKAKSMGVFMKEEKEEKKEIKEQEEIIEIEEEQKEEIEKQEQQENKANCHHRNIYCGYYHLFRHLCFNQHK